VVFGSFVTGKPEPQDVDLFLVMTDAFDASELRLAIPVLRQNLIPLDREHPASARHGCEADPGRTTGIF
jgi:hypothetical protein